MDLAGLYDKLFVTWNFFPIPRVTTLELLFWLSVTLLAVLTMLAKVSTFFAAIHSKLLLYIDGMIQMVASQDSKWSQPADHTASELPKQYSKRIVFIRHGESAWNEVFNRGFNLGFISRIVRACFREARIFASPYSYFFDTPLNVEGIDQALEIASFLEAAPGSSNPTVAEVISCLRGDTAENSLIVSSNLRRALSTVAIGLWRRLDRTGERIVINSMCQEISRNVDCMASAEPGTIPHMEGPDCGDAARRMAHPKRDGGAYAPEAIFNPSMNGGQKPLNERGVERLQAFADWAFTRPECTIIVGGHSLWFRNFFKAFLARSDEHVGKSQKMVNGGVVAFTLNVGPSPVGPGYWIEPGSITTVHGGFEAPKAKGKGKKL